MEQVIETYDSETQKLLDNNFENVVSPDTELEIRKLIQEDKYRMNNRIESIIDEIRMRITGLVGMKDDFNVSNLLEFKDRYLKNTETIKGLSNLFINSIFNSEQIKLIGAYDVERYYSSIYGTSTDLSEDRQLNLKIAEELYIINSLISDISFNEAKYRFIVECKNKK